MSLNRIILDSSARFVWRLYKILLFQRDVITQQNFCKEKLATVISSKRIACAVACVLGEVDCLSPHATWIAESHVESFLALGNYHRIRTRSSVPQPRFKGFLAKFLRNLLAFELIALPEVDVLDDLNFNDRAIWYRRLKVILDDLVIWICLNIHVAYDKVIRV
jgi:hypothetical protein